MTSGRVSRGHRISGEYARELVLKPAISSKKISWGGATVERLIMRVKNKNLQTNKQNKTKQHETNEAESVR